MKMKQRTIIIGTLAITLLVLAAFPTIGSITGDGFSWKSFSINEVSGEGASAIYNGDAAQIEKALGFSGTSGAVSADEMRAYLDTLRSNGIQITGAKSNLFTATQEDHFPLTVITLAVRNGDDKYQISCIGTVQSDKLVLIRFDTVWRDQSIDALPQKQIPDWIHELEAMLCTYNPG